MMQKYKVSLTITLPKKPKAEVITAVISAKDVASAISSMVGGVFADPSRRKSVIWYRDFSNKAFPRGYYKSEKRILISAIRSDVVDYPGAMSFPPNFLHGKINVEPITEETMKPPTSSKKPEQLNLFGSITAFGSRYVQVLGKDDEGLGVPYGKEDKVQLQELAKGKPKSKTQYAIFWRVFSPKAYALLEKIRPGSPSPEENDQWQQFVDKLRKSDAWILSDKSAVSKIPPDAVLGQINVADVRGMSASTRTLDAYVSGNQAYASIGAAFQGSPPPAQPQMPGAPM